MDYAPQYERPWCLIELVTAIEHGIPIVAVTLTSGAFAYDFAAASAYLESLDTELEARNPGASKLLHDNGIDLTHAAWQLSSTLPAIISTGFNPSASKNILTATISDVVEAIRKAKPLTVPPKEEGFLQKRTRSTQQHGFSARLSAAPSAQPPVVATLLAAASVPPEVPSLPASFLERPDIIASLKSAVLSPAAGGTPLRLRRPLRSGATLRA